MNFQSNGAQFRHPNEINIGDVSMKENDNNNNDDDYEHHIISPLHPRMSSLRKLYLLMFFNLLLIISFSYLFFSALSITFLHTYWTLALSFLIIFSTAFIITAKKRYLVSPSRNFFLMCLFNFEACFFLFIFLGMDSNKVILMLFVSADSILLSLGVYSMISQSVFNFEVSALAILAPNFMVFNVFLLFSEISLEGLIFATMASIIWGFYLIYETQSIMKFSRSGIEKSYIFIESITTYFDLFILALRNSELLFDVIIQKKSQKSEKPISNINMEEN